MIRITLDEVAFEVADVRNPNGEAMKILVFTCPLSQIRVQVAFHDAPARQLAAMLEGRSVLVVPANGGPADLKGNLPPAGGRTPGR